MLRRTVHGATSSADQSCDTSGPDMSPSDEPLGVPVKLTCCEWRFPPGIRKADEEPLKQAFVCSAFDWLKRTIREAANSLASDPERRLKVAFRLSTGGITTNHKTGQMVQILYSAIVRLEPEPTELFHPGSPLQIKEIIRISKRTFQHESAKGAWAFAG